MPSPARRALKRTIPSVRTPGLRQGRLVHGPAGSSGSPVSNSAGGRESGNAQKGKDLGISGISGISGDTIPILARCEDPAREHPKLPKYVLRPRNSRPRNSSPEFVLPADGKQPHANPPRGNRDDRPGFQFTAGDCQHLCEKRCQLLPLQSLDSDSHD